MTARVIAILWLALAAGLGLAWLDGLATERRREDAVAALQAHAFAAEGPVRARIEAEAQALLADELAASAPRQRTVAAAWAVVRHAPAAGASAQRIAARAHALVSAWDGSESRLRQADDLIGLLADPQATADLRARILDLAGGRAETAAALARGADALAATAGTAAGDQRLVELVAAYRRLVADGGGRAGLTWLARESAPLAGPLEAAADAAYGHLDALLRPYRQALVRDPSPVEIAAVVRAVARAQPERRERLRAAWDAIGAMDLRQRCDRGTLALYAAAARREQLPVAALAVCLGIAALVFGGLALAFRRLVRGRRAIDPAAETVPNVEPIELDSDAITLQRATSDETRVD